MKIASAVVGGYILGRRKKAKLAITMGAWLLGKKLNLNPQQLVTDLTKQLSTSPQLSGVRDQLRGEVMSAGKTMATAIATRQADKLTGALQDRTEKLGRDVQDTAGKTVDSARDTVTRSAGADSGTDESGGTDRGDGRRKANGGAESAAKPSRRTRASSASTKTPAKRTKASASGKTTARSGSASKSAASRGTGTRKAAGSRSTAQTKRGTTGKRS
ncbi:hypothetical protein BAY61_20885 [Prauserella marina]|nr:hypothetical protein BAY61_20885 [Prauserella marina]